MKTCNKCGQTKPLADFPKGGTKSGTRASCKPCRNSRQKETVESKRLREKQQALMDLAAKDEAYLAARNIAAPRTYAPTEPWVPNDHTYYRNDGLKHIQSRGV